MSLGDSMSSVYACIDGHVNSPDLRNPKKPKQKAAQSITLSKCRGSCDHFLCTIHSSSGVTGNRVLLEEVGRNR